MGYFRSSLKQSGGSGEDYSETYTTTVNGIRDKGSCCEMFKLNTLFNENVVIGNNVKYCQNMFHGCLNLNQNIQIPNSVYNCQNMFSSCYNLNQNIQPPNSGGNLSYMFFHCNNLNQNIKVPDAFSCSHMFYFCNNLNQNIQISDNVIDCAYMFSSCGKLNQNIKIPNNAVSCFGMFANCSSFNQGNINIPESVTIMWEMFIDCNNLKCNLYIKGNSYRQIDIRGLFGNNTAKRKNIWINNVLYNVIHNANIISETDGYVVPTWTTMTNGFYNTKYNVYCYTNYSG